MRRTAASGILAALCVLECGGLPEPAVPVKPPTDMANIQPGAEARASMQIRLCSWNLKKLGHGESKDFGVIRSILDEHCDFAAIVEVMQKGGGHPGYEALMAALGAGWNGTVTPSPRPNTGVGNAEFYAAVWRPTKVSWCDGWESLTYFSDNDGSRAGRGADRFSREPAYGCFRAVAGGGFGFDFLVGIYHARWENGDSSKTADEVRKLGLVIAEMKRARAGENDVFVVGDFNLVPSKLARATTLSDWTEGEGSTLNIRGERTANLYDHVLVDDPSASPELRRKAQVIDVRRKSASPQAFEQTVSDHLPIVIDVAVFRADDD